MKPAWVQRHCVSSCIARCLGHFYSIGTLDIPQLPWALLIALSRLCSRLSSFTWKSAATASPPSRFSQIDIEKQPSFAE